MQLTFSSLACTVRAYTQAESTATAKTLRAVFRISAEEQHLHLRLHLQLQAAEKWLSLCEFGEAWEALLQSLKREGIPAIEDCSRRCRRQASVLCFVFLIQLLYNSQRQPSS